MRIKGWQELNLPSTKKVLGFPKPESSLCKYLSMAPNNNLGDIFSTTSAPALHLHSHSVLLRFPWQTSDSESLSTLNVLLQFDTRIRKKYHCSFIVPQLLWTPSCLKMEMTTTYFFLFEIISAQPSFLGGDSVYIIQPHNVHLTVRSIAKNRRRSPTPSSRFWVSFKKWDILGRF